jgi:ATP-binding cassette subfamily A (ABC1) protein 3
MIMGGIDENFMFVNGNIPSDDEKPTNKGGLTLRKSMLGGTIDADTVEVLNYQEVVNRADLIKQEADGMILNVAHLRKTYPNGFTAVKDLNVKMYTGQIFALLGHNGAGKTTVISMLTGLLSPTAGEAQAFGHDIFSDITSVREFLGVCPQHNILFDMLTPREHLEIFSDFKGNINIIILICIYL